MTSSKAFRLKDMLRREVFSYTICNTRVYDLKLHMRRVHGSEGPQFRCDICNKEYHSFKGLYLHRKGWLIKVSVELVLKRDQRQYECSLVCVSLKGSIFMAILLVINVICVQQNLKKIANSNFIWKCIGMVSIDDTRAHFLTPKLWRKPVTLPKVCFWPTCVYHGFLQNSGGSKNDLLLYHSV